MSFLIIRAFDKTAAEILAQWKRGDKRKEIKDQFIQELGKGIYLTEATGEMLALVWSLRERYDSKVDVFVADLLTDHDIPYGVKEASKCLVEKPTSVEVLKRVRGLRMRCSVSSNETSLDLYESPKIDLRGPFEMRQKD